MIGACDCCSLMVCVWVLVRVVWVGACWYVLCVGVCYCCPPFPSPPSPPLTQPNTPSTTTLPTTPQASWRTAPRARRPSSTSTSSTRCVFPLFPFTTHSGIYMHMMYGCGAGGWEWMMRPPSFHHTQSSIHMGVHVHCVCTCLCPLPSSPIHPIPTTHDPPTHQPPHPK